MTKTGWVLAKPKMVRRANVYDGGVSEAEWIRDPSFPTVYPTNLAAKRAYVVAFEPCLAAASDAFIKAHFHSFARNLKMVKVMRFVGSKP